MRLPGSSFLLFCAATLLVPATARAQTFKFYSVGFVTPAAVNSSGTIAGSFCCSYTPGFDGPEQEGHGFMLQMNRRGTQVFKVTEPNGSADSFATGIDPASDVVGGFCPGIESCSSGNAIHGFLFSGSSNSAQAIDVPGALATLAGGINGTGQIVGMYCNATTCSLNYAADSNGFLLDHIGGTFTTIAFPGAIGTAASAINDSGQIVGIYEACQTPNSGSEVLRLPCTFVQPHGFLLSGGTYTTIDPPDSTNTLVGAINNSGAIAGTYADASNKSHGFLLKAGFFTIVDYPGATGTAITGVNDHGEIVGSAYFNSRIENFIGIPQ